MNDLRPRFRTIFLELFESLPRQGPDNLACAMQALALCGPLPPTPVVLDLGCGVGGQPLHLARLLPGKIVALGLHAPCIEKLRATVAAHGLSPQVFPVIADMAHPGQRPGRFDLVWSEGALYQIAIEKALEICRELLRPGGCLAFTNTVWRTTNPPPGVKARFDFDDPEMSDVSAVLAAIDRCGYFPAGHFPLPDEAWWDDFHTPMEIHINQLRRKYREDAEALAGLDQFAREPGRTTSWNTCTGRDRNAH